MMNGQLQVDISTGTGGGEDDNDDGDGVNNGGIWYSQPIEGGRPQQQRAKQNGPHAGVK